MIRAQADRPSRVYFIVTAASQARPMWTPRPRGDNAMVKALARAFRWRKGLDEGVHATIDDLV